MILPSNWLFEFPSPTLPSRRPRTSHHANRTPTARLLNHVQNQTISRPWTSGARIKTPAVETVGAVSLSRTEGGPPSRKTPSWTSIATRPMTYKTSWSALRAMATTRLIAGARARSASTQTCSTGRTGSNEPSPKTASGTNEITRRHHGFRSASRGTKPRPSTI